MIFFTKAADQASSDAYKLNGCTYNPDEDSLTRLISFPITTPEEHNSIPNQPIFVQDFPLNPTHKTWLRLYKPISPPANTKLPIIIYFHGSGFIVSSASYTVSHDFCNTMAVEFLAIVVSVGYRLAPENRLPAAYDDAIDAINWVRNQALDLVDIADLTSCYLTGSSAGGNIAYHAALRAVSLNLMPLVIKGLILNQPYFSGLERTGSELRLANDEKIPLAMSDGMWELALPEGSNRDHEFCNPLVDGCYKDKIGLLGRCFVNGRGGDLLFDKEREFAKMLEENGVDVETWFVEDGGHGDDLFYPDKTRDFIQAVKNFISSSSFGDGKN